MRGSNAPLPVLQQDRSTSEHADRLDPSVRERYDGARGFADKAVRSACYAPYVSLYLTGQGKVLACCRNGSLVLGDIRVQSLSDIWRGDRTRQLRQSLASYQFHRDCGYCSWEITTGARGTATPLLFDELPVASVDPDWPAQLEFDGSSTCNFECIMCNGNVSSAIRARRDGLPPLPRVYGDAFFDDLRKFLPHLTRARFFGGEPFLTPESRRVWEIMISDGLRTECHVTTNGSQFNARVERYLDALPFHLTVSIDGATRATAESIRVNCRFDELLANISRFQRYAESRGTGFGLAFCLMRQNWHELLDLLVLAENMGARVLVNTVVDPSHCSLYTLPRPHLEKILCSLDAQTERAAARLIMNYQTWHETLVKLRGAVSDDQHRRMSGILNNFYVLDSEVRSAADHVRRGNYAEGLRIASGVDKRDPDAYLAVNVQAHAHLLLGDISAANAAVADALELSDRRPEAHLNSARVLTARGCMADALDAVHAAADRAPPEDRVAYEAAELLAFLHVRRANAGAAIKALYPIVRLQELATPLAGVSYPAAGLRPTLAREAGQSSVAVLVCNLLRLTLAASRSLFRLRQRLSRRGNHHDAIETPRLTALPHQPTWSFRVAPGNTARTRVVPDASDQVRIEISRCAASVLHDIQLNRSAAAVKAGQRYRVTYRARADAPRSIAIGCAQAREPWEGLGLYAVVNLTSEWSEHEHLFVASADEHAVRLHVDAGVFGSSVDIGGMCMVALEVR